MSSNQASFFHDIRTQLRSIPEPRKRLLRDIGIKTLLIVVGVTVAYWLTWWFIESWLRAGKYADCAWERELYTGFNPNTTGEVIPEPSGPCKIKADFAMEYFHLATGLIFVGLGLLALVWWWFRKNAILVPDWTKREPLDAAAKITYYIAVGISVIPLITMLSPALMAATYNLMSH